MPSNGNDISQEELGIIGRSPAIREAVERLRRVAPTDLSILIIGESGVGKEVFARATHRLSLRAGGAMLAINCGAIPETLLESELFGHEKGAFTGAVESRKGIFEAADGGTIFLDEIGEMTAATQVKFLRVLETGEFSRVGSAEVRHADVRIVAATNRDLVDAVRTGAFREDLYYRLNTVRITIPPLRQRPEDIQLLFAYFAWQTSQRLGRPFGGITPEAMSTLMNYPWPGNVRELRNFTELVITLHHEGQITPEIVFEHLDRDRLPKADSANALIHLKGRTPEEAERELIYRALVDLRNEVVGLKGLIESSYAKKNEETEQTERFALPPRPATLEETIAKLGNVSLEDVERAMILDALHRYNGNRRQAAEVLGISERTLYRKLGQYKDEGFIVEDEA